MTTSLKFKEKATELDTRSYKCLLLALVKLIHADPKLMLHVRLPPHSDHTQIYPVTFLNLLLILCVCVSVCPCVCVYACILFIRTQ